jgi:hypothetical protein
MLPSELIELGESGPAAIVGSADAAGVPEMSRGWGVQVLADANEVVICVPSRSGRRLLANLEHAGRMAVVMTSPRTYRSFQVKGRVVAIAPASADDRDRAAAHQHAFVESAYAVGLPRESARRLFTDRHGEPLDADLTTVRMKVEALFDQTPGPGAGARL